MYLVNALNAVHDNVWALVIIAGGIVLTCCGKGAEGGTLVTLGAAVFQRSSNRPADPPPTK